MIYRVVRKCYEDKLVINVNSDVDLLNPMEILIFAKAVEYDFGNRIETHFQPNIVMEMNTTKIYYINDDDNEVEITVSTQQPIDFNYLNGKFFNDEIYNRKDKA